MNGSTVNGRLPVNMAYMLTPLNRNKSEFIIGQESSNLAHDKLGIDCNVRYIVNPACADGSDRGVASSKRGDPNKCFCW